MESIADSGISCTSCIECVGFLSEHQAGMAMRECAQTLARFALEKNDWHAAYTYTTARAHNTQHTTHKAHRAGRQAVRQAVAGRQAGRHYRS